MKLDKDMAVAIEDYLSAIKRDYRGRGELSEIRAEMVREFDAAIRYEIHRKFIKVITGPQTSVHSFIMREADGKFKRGDILKAASWKAPAKNFARGNVFSMIHMNGVRWTGA